MTCAKEENLVKLFCPASTPRFSSYAKSMQAFHLRKDGYL